jgi:hypothetical protein
MRQDFRRQSLNQLNMLALQFVLGMILNLFVTLPDKHPGQTGGYIVRSAHSFSWAITFGGGVALFLHVLVAVGLMGGGIGFFIRASKKREKFWIWISGIGLLGIVVAFSNGLAFLDFNKDASSFIMAMGYIAATIAYVSGLMQPQFSTKKAN